MKYFAGENIPIYGIKLLKPLTIILYTDIILTINDLDDVLEALWGARARWNDIGRKIGVDTGTLATMKGSDNDCLRDTLTHWLRGVYKPDEQNSRPRTWCSLIEALRARAVNEAAMANELEREKYPGTN